MTENENGHHKPAISVTPVAKKAETTENGGYIHFGDETINEKTIENTVYLHTGNIANWSNLKSRKSSDIPAHELHQSFARTLEQGLKDKGSLETNRDAYITCQPPEKLDDNERGLLKVTVKIFLQKYRIEAMKEAIDASIAQLGLRHIDSVYLSLPELPPDSKFADVILPFWEELERLKELGLTTQISSCDLDREKLETLVGMVRIKPEVNQVNLASCCHMPEELVKYAKENNIVLHTHGDQSIMLSDETLQDIMRRLDPSDTRNFNTEWLVRYAVIVKCRGVIQNKGYIVAFKATGENKKKQEQKNGAQKMALKQDGLQAGCVL